MSSVSGHDGERISVVVPCYNCRTYVGEALESILSQTRRVDEIIVVDDGSTDGSGDEIARFASHARYVRQQNQGIAGARNCGIALAEGSLLAFLDADDLWPAGSIIARLEPLLADSTIAASFGLVEQFATGGASVAQLPARQPGRLIGAMLARRAVFTGIGWFDASLKVGETLDWMARLDESGARTVTVDQLVLRRRIHASNTVRGAAQMHTDYLRLLRSAIARRRAEAAK